MEGVNMGGFMLGYLAVFVLGGAFLVALGLLLAGWSKAARFLFASGFLLAMLITAVAALSFLQPEYHREDSEAISAGVAAVVVLLAGMGQFIAAFRGAGRYAAALACALALPAFGILWVVGGSDVMPFKLPGGAVISSLLAAASLVIAVFPRFGEGPTEPHRPDE